MTMCSGRCRKVLSCVDNKKQLASDTVTEALYVGLINKLPGTSTENKEDIKTIDRQFDNFKRSGIHSVLKHGDAPSSDIKTADTKFNSTLQSSRSSQFLNVTSVVASVYL